VGDLATTQQLFDGIDQPVDVAAYPGVNSTSRIFSLQ